MTYLVERRLPRDLLILLWSPSGKLHQKRKPQIFQSKLFFRTTARPTGVPGKLPALRCLMSAALQAYFPCRWHTNPLSFKFPSCRRHSLLQKTLPCRRHTYPLQTPAVPGTLATFETRSLSTSLISVRRGPKCTEFTDVFNLLHVLHCNRSALHCAALFWTLNCCNCMSAIWSISAR